MPITRWFLSLVMIVGLSPYASLLSAAESTGLSVSVSVSPVPNRPNDCLFKAEITDLSDGKLIAAPSVIVQKGEAGKVSTGDRGTYTLVLDLSVDKSGSSATYSVTYSKRETVVAIQKGSISIR